MKDLATLKHPKFALGHTLLVQGSKGTIVEAVAQKHKHKIRWVYTIKFEKSGVRMPYTEKYLEYCENTNLITQNIIIEKKTTWFFIHTTDIKTIIMGTWFHQADT